MDGTCLCVPVPRGGHRFFLSHSMSLFLQELGQNSEMRQLFAVLHDLSLWVLFLAPSAPQFYKLDLLAGSHPGSCHMGRSGCPTVRLSKPGCWGPAVRRPSRCHYSKAAEAQSQLWVAWASSLLYSPCLINSLQSRS